MAELNTTTGVWTNVGALGIIPFYAQGCAFDRSDGKLYWAAFQQSLVSDLRRIDTTTGASTVIGTWQTSAEMDGMMIPSVPPVNTSALCEQFTAPQVFPPAGWSLVFTGTQYWLGDTTNAYCQGGQHGDCKYNFYLAPAASSQSMITTTFTPSILTDFMLFL